MEEKYFTKHKAGEWKFNNEVAESFDIIAEKNIPHYKIVIEKLVQITKKLFVNNYDIKIIDVGSATGQTMDAFIRNGFRNVYGVESSAFMIDASVHKERVILSETFPTGTEYHMITANWTVHFINNRDGYLADVYNSLHKDGYFILTEKISSSPVVHSMYHDFKREKGVPEEEIIRKAIALEGVLVTKPLSWYLDTLKKIGFSEVEIIDADWCFVTMLCKK